MVDSATGDHFGLAAYRRQGFVGSEDDNESVSKTLEYAYDDWCIARMAEALGRRELADEYDRRSQAWRHLLDPRRASCVPRATSAGSTPFDPRRVDNHYTEANSWQYSLFVPHDVEGLIEALGGEAPFVERLDALFEAAERDDRARSGGHHRVDRAVRPRQRAQPSHGLAVPLRRPARAEREARAADPRRAVHGQIPDGLSGNEDCGQMSSLVRVRRDGSVSGHARARTSTCSGCRCSSA